MGAIVKVYDGLFRKSLLSFEGKKELGKFMAEHGTTTWILPAADASGALGTPHAESDARRAGAEYISGANLVRVASVPFETSCVWNATTHDGADCFVRATLVLSIADPAAFLKVWGPAILANGELAEISVGNRVMVDSASFLAQEIASVDYDSLKRFGLSSAWQKGFFTERVARLGLRFDGARFEFEAPDAEKRAEEERRREEHDALIRRERDAAKLEETRRQLAHDVEMARLAREDQRRALQQETARRETELARQEELDRLAYEQKRLDLEQSVDAARRQPGELDALREQVAGLVAANQEFQRQMSAMLAAMAAPTPQRPQTSPQLAAELAGVSDETIARLRPTDPKAFFSRVFNEKKVESESSRVHMSLKTDRPSLTRDVVYRRDYHSLRIGGRLIVEFTTPINGYATVLNLGTSGNFWLLAPNGGPLGVAPNQAIVRAGARYRLPGPELYRYGLDGAEGVGIFEGGPVGWEEFVVIVSCQPLFADAERINRRQPDNPFTLVSADRLNALLGQLALLDAGDWAVGSIGFQVQ